MAKLSANLLGSVFGPRSGKRSSPKTETRTQKATREIAGLGAGENREKFNRLSQEAKKLNVIVQPLAEGVEPETVQAAVKDLEAKVAAARGKQAGRAGAIKRRAQFKGINLKTEKGILKFVSEAAGIGLIKPGDVKNKGVLQRLRKVAERTASEVGAKDISARNKVFGATVQRLDRKSILLGVFGRAIEGKEGAKKIASQLVQTGKVGRFFRSPAAGLGAFLGLPLAKGFIQEGRAKGAATRERIATLSDPEQREDLIQERAASENLRQADQERRMRELAAIGQQSPQLLKVLLALSAGSSQPRLPEGVTRIGSQPNLDVLLQSGAFGL